MRKSPQIEKWYYSKSLKPVGPFTGTEMRALIHRGEVGPHDLISLESDGAWRPAMEWGVFEMTLFPATQEFIPGGDIQTEERQWVLLVPSEKGHGFIQEGPCSHTEIRELLKKQSLSGNVYVWKAGLSGWSRLQDRPEFAGLI